MAAITKEEFDAAVKKVKDGVNVFEAVPKRVSDDAKKEIAEYEAVKKALNNPRLSPDEREAAMKRQQVLSEAFLPMKVPIAPVERRHVELKVKRIARKKGAVKAAPEYIQMIRQTVMRRITPARKAKRPAQDTRRLARGRAY
jgi:hypothetical protein